VIDLSHAILISVKGYTLLTDPQRQLFDSTYFRHLNVFGDSDKRNYTPEQIEEIKVDHSEECLKVYFKNGDWWHYDKHGNWY